MNHNDFLEPIVRPVFASVESDGSDTVFVPSGCSNYSFFAGATFLSLVGKPIFDLLE
jgi:hypothetical protein